MAKEIAKSKTDSIPVEQIDMIEYHQTLRCYMIILHDTKRLWYAKEFTATPTELKGDFRDDRF